MNQFIIVILFFLPAGIANAIPPLVKRLPLLRHWKTPIDFGITFRGKRMLGPNKTWRGLLLGSICGGLIAKILYPLLVTKSSSLTSINLEAYFLIGFLLGAGALLGDAVESFFKRQIGKPSGSSWLFFDQLDYIAGAILFSLPFVHFSLAQYAVMIISYFCMHIVISYLGYKIGVKDQPI